MKKKNIVLILLLALTITVSGCARDNPATKSNPGNNTGNSTPESSRYVEGDENSTLTVVTDEDARTYILTWETEEDYSQAEDNELLNKANMVNMTAHVQCGLLQQIAYNYSSVRREFGAINRTEAPENEIPQEVFEEYKATEVNATIYNRNGSQKLASCSPDAENLNINLMTG